ncbi:MAG: hypothetical protein JOZ46_12450 [Candidatus Dormibacteraeota bacterium]|nr:hypothetical protein [Candidatus Dormibacteraeota bacterium]MBV9526611.1 hypothetical protein [Candidatus Dormibacteraeota bacterium]
MNIADSLKVAAGAVIVLSTLYDVFQGVVLPRPAVGRFRLGRWLVRLGWKAWRAVAERPGRVRIREAALAAYAPSMVVALLVTWAVALVLGYALMYSGLHDGLHPAPGSFGAAIYFSAGRMLAFPAASIEATGLATPLLTSVEAATGFGLFALVISLLFSLVTSFQRRETAVVALEGLAGAPPSGVQLLETCAKFQMPQHLEATFETWRVWTADVLESHLSYPLLFYFRSSHDNDAWPNSFGAVMDAAVLVMSVVKSGPQGPAHLMYKVGVHFAEDMRQTLGFDYESAAGVEESEFLEACFRLQRAGYDLRDMDSGWEEFRRLRSSYGTWLNLVARALAVQPAPWIGDRSYLPHRDGAWAGQAGSHPAQPAL